MKKTYKAPNILIAKIKVQHHLCTESIETGNYNGGSIESRRRGSVWEDDDEE